MKGHHGVFYTYYIFLTGALCHVLTRWVNNFFFTIRSGLVGIILWPSGIADIWVPVGCTENNSAHSLCEVFWLGKNCAGIWFHNLCVKFWYIFFFSLRYQKFCTVNWERSVLLKDVPALLENWKKWDNVGCCSFLKREGAGSLASFLAAALLPCYFSLLKFELPVPVTPCRHRGSFRSNVPTDWK